MRWQVRKVHVQYGVDEDLDALDELLSEHWEPFAVTWNGRSHVYHLRQLVSDK